jgi:hypothetical protein
MRRRPLIGVPTQTLQAIDDIPEGLPHSWVMNRRYFIALTSVGAAPVMLPLLDDDPTTMREIFERLDGLFLAGGVDLDPASYGSEREEHCGRTDEARDTVEIEVARWAIERGMPVLGVCRGMQILNVVYGGSLHQDCAACLPDSIKHDYFPTAGFARVYFDTCVYHQPGIDLLFEVIDADNILFGSEMVGAVRGLDPETGQYFDDTKRYVDALEIPAEHKAKVFELNARRVYPRLDAILKGQGR